MVNLNPIPYNEAVDAAARKKGMLLVGWIWRKPGGRQQWTFSKNIYDHNPPPGTEFVPVYVDEGPE